MASNGRIWRVKIKNSIGNYVTFAGVQEESMTFGNKAIDVTDKQSDGYRHQITRGGQAVDFSGSGVAIDNEGYHIIKRAVRDNTFVELLMESEFDRLLGSFHISGYSESASHEGAVNFSASFASTAAYTYQIPFQVVSNGVLDSGATFTRASTATYFGSDGLLKTAAIDEARNEYDPATGENLGLLVEEQRTNSLLHNRDLSQAVWTGTATKTKDAVGIDGAANTAWTITDGSVGDAQNLLQDVTVANDTATHTAYFHIKKDSDVSRFPAILCQLLGGDPALQRIVLNTKTGSFVEVNSDGTVSVDEKISGWWTIEISLENDATGNTTLRTNINPAFNSDGTVSASPAATGSCVYDFGQVELNASFSTSPIETAGSAVTRSADVATSPIGAEFNPVEFSVICEFVYEPVLVSSSAVFEIGNGTSANRFLLSIKPSDIELLVRKAGATEAIFNFSLPAVGSTVKLAASFAEDDVRACMNGGAVQSDTNATMPTVTDRTVGDSGAVADREINSTIRTITEYPRALSDARLVELSTL